MPLSSVTSATILHRIYSLNITLLIFNTKGFFFILTLHEFDNYFHLLILSI